MTKPRKLRSRVIVEGHMEPGIRSVKPTVFLSISKSRRKPFGAAAPSLSVSVVIGVRRSADLAVAHGAGGHMERADPFVNGLVASRSMKQRSA